MRQRLWQFLVPACLAVAAASAARAGDDAPPQAAAPPGASCADNAWCPGLRAWWCRWTAHLRTEPGPCGSWPLNRSEHTDARAGDPRAISRWARPSDSAHETGGYVGGGSWNWRQGEARTAEEGTWGWDQRTNWLVRDPFLQWWNGRRSQGGTGAYQTDGPCAPDLPPVHKDPGTTGPDR